MHLSYSPSHVTSLALIKHTHHTNPRPTLTITPHDSASYPQPIRRAQDSIRVYMLLLVVVLSFGLMLLLVQEGVGRMGIVRWVLTLTHQRQVTSRMSTQWTKL